MRPAIQTALTPAPGTRLARPAGRLAMAASVALALAGPARASAQEIGVAVRRTAGVAEPRARMEQAFLGEVGHRHAFGWGDLRLSDGPDADLRWAEVDLGEHGVRAIADLPFDGRRWKVAGWLVPTVRGAVNAASEMTALGADLRLAGGHYARGWLVALEAGLDWIAATHVTYGGAWRTGVPTGAGDGWYRTPGGTAYAGLLGGASFTFFDLILRAGRARTTAADGPAAPYYLTVGVNVTL